MRKASKRVSRGGDIVLWGISHARVIGAVVILDDDGMEGVQGRAVPYTWRRDC
jgi:hypothetical protein